MAQETEKSGLLNLEGKLILFLPNSSGIVRKSGIELDDLNDSTGVVVMIGDDLKDSKIKVGSEMAYRKGAGDEIVINEVRHLIVAESQLLYRIE